MMRIFNRRSSHKKDNILWEELTSIEQLDVLKSVSQNIFVGIFKHSTRCMISSSVLRRFKKEALNDLPLKMYYLDLLSYRSISNEIANRFQVPHQSPQLLLIKEGEIVKNASHYDILTVDLEVFVK